VTEKAGRSWGYWTRAKLRILEDYLPAFLTASGGKAKEIIYLDAFAGEGSGLDRLTGEEFKGSARIALDLSQSGGFTKLRYFEQESKAKELEEQLRATYPGRDIQVYGGDCNVKIRDALNDLKPFKWAPTFAFVDPDGMELSWHTLELLAAHKRGYRRDPTKREYKVELWLLFPTQGLVRTLSHDPTKITKADRDRADRLYGTPAWRTIYEKRRFDEISAAEAKDEYVNLLRWRLENELGYASTHPLELKNTRGGTIYHMIFATDNEAGERIMSDLYGRAAGELPDMLREARDRQSGQMDLGFDIGPTTVKYTYEPPWTPLGLDESTSQE
jgi:three-Cys-motif partner protein